MVDIGKHAKKFGSGVKALVKSHEFVGQGLAQIPKFGISLVSTELGNKIWNTLIGAVGNLVNEAYNTGKKTHLPLRSAFTNMMFTFADPTANQMREIKRNWQDLVGGLKMKSFSTAFGALVEEPQEVVAAIKGSLPSLKGFKAPSLKTFKKNIPLSSDKIIQAVDTSAISTYKPSFGSPLADDDIVDY